MNKIESMDKLQDGLSKAYYSNPRRCASFFRSVTGNPDIKASNLNKLNTELVDITIKEDKPAKIVRIRDLLFLHEDMILGIEHQSTVNPYMDQKMVNYDLMTLMEVKQKVKELRSVILYTGEKPWKTYKDQLPKNWQRALDEVEAIVVEMRKNELTFDEPDLQALYDIVKWIYQEDYGKIEGKYKGVEIDKETAMMIYVITSFEGLDELIKKSEGGIDMCVALENLKHKCKNEGINLGLIEGEAKGKDKQKFLMIKTMLENGLDEDTILKSGCTLEDIQQARLIH